MVDRGEIGGKTVIASAELFKKFLKHLTVICVAVDEDDSFFTWHLPD